jgi:hypothetical protein
MSKGGLNHAPEEHEQKTELKGIPVKNKHFLADREVFFVK